MRKLTGLLQEVQREFALRRDTIPPRDSVSGTSAGGDQERQMHQERQVHPDRAEEEGNAAGPGGFDIIRQWFSRREERRQQAITSADRQLSNTFRFLKKTFGEGQEMIIFLSELAAGYYSLQFVNDCGNEEYEKYNHLLLLRDRRETLRSELREMMEL